MKQREDYNVYRVETYYGECGEVTKRSHFAGKTKAVSKAQAENNVRFRHNGESPSILSFDLGRDTALDITYRAVLARDDT